MICCHFAIVMSAFPETQDSGSGHPSLPLVAFALLETAIAESSMLRAARITSGYAESSGTSSDGTAGVMIAAESYISATLARP